MKSPFILLILIFFSIVGCSSNRNKYPFVSKVIKDISEKGHFTKINVLEETATFSPSFLKNVYLEHKKIHDKKGPFPSDGKFHWKDNKFAWYISESEVNYMTQKFQIQQKRFWEKKYLKSCIKDSVIIIENPFVKRGLTLKSLENEINNNINENRPVFVFSTPIFNRKNDKAVIAYNHPFLLGSGMILFYKKVNNEWIFVGSYY
ncbi:hypothetical protein GV828_02885 [Flavobacterium sp. NST-5]|uniref:Lipoprotein n=1 Tax=Flavobacterium ichthyis TaxID=2698827 RepID=A0ABW9Z5M1_9FLAO|nr:hypothetical protein [Flavobacterium ichthyis]NBL64142.1 hypothetical protein [Flavobacterium ichthyis]